MNEEPIKTVIQCSKKNNYISTTKILDMGCQNSKPL